jgi:ATP-dependent Lon protease
MILFEPSFDGSVRAESVRSPGPRSREKGSPPETDSHRLPVIPAALPVLPVREAVVFPGTVVPLNIGRASSVRLIEDLKADHQVIAIFTQKNPAQDEPQADDLYRVGVAAAVVRVVKQEDGKIVAIVHAHERVAFKTPLEVKPYLCAEVEVLHSAPLAPSAENKAAVNSLRETALRLLGLKTNVADQVSAFVRGLDDPGMLADFIASGLDVDSEEKQSVLEQLDVGRRIRAVQRHISRQLHIAELQAKIQKDVASQFSDAQRRAYLHEQIKVIQKELGEEQNETDEPVAQLREKLAKAAPPKAVLEQAERELKRLEVMPPASAEFSVVVNYVETLASLPWNTQTQDNLDLDHAQRILDRDHHGLTKVKQRLIEYLAVRKLNPKNQGPLLCLLGPPGVGKTSLGLSIAQALGRKFARVSLGGARDEADIRGHRRTYVGAMPGRLIEELRRAGSRNPVMLLDEIDKLGADFRGDPASALLEVLDPAQNKHFVDHFIDLPFDLSQVLFIATANQLGPVPPALRDRLEVIELRSYTESEKRAIATRHLIPRQRKEHGLTRGQLKFQSAAIAKIITDYTREAGVRELERQIAALCRHAAARIARAKAERVTVTPALVEEVLGPKKFLHDEKLKAAGVGVVTGLAWTPVGGEILHIEALRYPGKGNVQLTGQLGDVMKESVQAAVSLVHSRAVNLGITEDAFKESDVHVHVPSGAVPKDGPSAGVAMFTALASIFAGRRVRADVAMTGEISLRGLVLPIGGLKEKALAALRAGIHTVLIPRLNEKDLADIPEEARRKLDFVFVDTVDDVLRIALER